MKILFLGDVVGLSGCRKISNDLLDQTQKKDIDFVIINGENADDTGVGLTEEICKNFFVDLPFSTPSSNIIGLLILDISGIKNLSNLRLYSSIKYVKFKFVITTNYT